MTDEKTTDTIDDCLEDWEDWKNWNWKDVKVTDGIEDIEDTRKKISAMFIQGRHYKLTIIEPWKKTNEK